MASLSFDFEKMKKDRAENDFSFSKSDFPVEKVIKKEEPNIIRIFSPVYVKYYRCWALSDPDAKGERRNIPVITYNESEGTSLFGQMLGDERNFFKGGILETVKQGNLAVPKYQEADPDLIALLFYKNDFSGRSGSWKPRREFIFNVIDRDPEISEGKKVVWCVQNKKTKVLRFIPMAFDNLVACMENEGPDVQNYDINYTIRLVNSRVNHYIQKAGPMLPNVVIGPLTDEELQYQTWDLLDAVKLSSASFCLKWFRQTIERISYAMQVDWIGRFEKASRLEQSKASDETSNEIESIVVKTSGDTVPRFQNNVATESSMQQPLQPQPSPIARNIEQNNLASTPIENTSNNIQKASNFANYTPPTFESEASKGTQVRRMATKVEGEKVACGHCKQSVSPSDEFCPHCRNQLLAPCEKCNKLFSVFESVCPYCGAQYTLM